jgi:putative NADH-flavin reductase
MHLLVFGATDGTGRQLVTQALEQGHTVTACVRMTASLGINHPNLRVFRGNILDEQAVVSAVFGADVVLAALGSRERGLPDLIQGTRNILAAMYQCEVRRSIWVSSFGVGESLGQMGWLARNVIVKGFLRAAIEARAIQERIITQSEGDWIIVRPGSLTDGPHTGVYRIIPSAAQVQINRPAISRADVADFMLKNLTDNTYVRQAVGLSY